MPPPIVFTGLSISREEAMRFVPADVRPPVKRGDLDRLSDGSVVAIIDGEITPETAVPIDEIRRALRRGIKISGAASVGALRAYETRARGHGGAGMGVRGLLLWARCWHGRDCGPLRSQLLSSPHHSAGECPLLPGGSEPPTPYQRHRGGVCDDIIEGIETREA